MPKQITLQLPEWANWISQDYDGVIAVYDVEPLESRHTFFVKQEKSTAKRISNRDITVANWRESKINLNTHGAYIDDDGILHKCELKDNK